MPDDTLRWPGGWARLGSWRGQHDVAYLAVGAQRPPSAEILDRCLRTLRGRGYQRVLTNALAPAEALPFVDAGFSVHERLHLLAHDLADIPAGTHETRRGRREDHPAVLALDAGAFRPFWRLDCDGLEQALEATPAARYRLVEDDGGLCGYAITGRADRRGYLQRVGVDPSAQGRGIGRTLVADALRWLRRHRAHDAVVNTQLDNDAALALYRACGFRELPSGLCVMSRSL
jgi:ribosomal protein S18 acetylase RimI-like enzyme